MAYDEFKDRFYFLTQLCDNNTDMDEELSEKTDLYHVYTNDLDSDFTEECIIHFQKHCAEGIDHQSDKSLGGISKLLRCNSLQNVSPN
ncbi:hypothetical protein JTB14_019810 [Gonioctena quinquepunctata]|nr:hypothetical protein JTB14_019810 [Gonioctena quinquepunctata]